jgi:hypothetical protein
VAYWNGIVRLPFLDSEKIRVSEMNYRWPLPHPDPVLDDALDIALRYLEATGQAKAGGRYAAPCCECRSRRLARRKKTENTASQHRYRLSPTGSDIIIKPNKEPALGRVKRLSCSLMPQAGTYHFRKRTSFDVA